MIKLAIFDMDGTVFESHLDWVKIRQTLGINGNILEEIYKNNGVNQEKLAVLEQFETANTVKTLPIKGIEIFLEFLKSCKIRAVLVTNNNKKNTDFLLRKFQLTFNMVITREQKLWKPSPAPFLYVMEQNCCKQDETISIGDSHYDVEASRQAGINQIYIIKNEKTINLNLSAADQVTFFNDYFELMEMLKR